MNGIEWKPWHDYARIMREQGHTLDQIASTCGASRHAIYTFFLTPEKRAEQRENDKLRRRAMRGTDCEGEALKRTLRGVAPRPKLPPAPRPDVDAWAECRRFAAGEIDRDELSRRLRAGRIRWPSKSL
jgi:hypothetical protein